MRSLSLVGLIGLAVFWSSGCSEIGATNPYDPKAAKSAQAPGTVEGEVQLSRAVGARGLTAVSIGRRPAGSPEATPVIAHPGADGAFQLDDLEPGSYELEFALGGYQSQRRGFEVGIGQVVNLGTVALYHDSESGEASTPFRARVVLRGQTQHDGTTVRLIVAGRDVPLATAVTDSLGDVVIPASRAETYRVEIDRPGFELATDPGTISWRADSNDVDDGGFFSAESNSAERIVLTLDPLPLDGSISVTATILPDWLPLEQRTATLRIEGPQPDESQIASGTAAGAGGLPPGTYVITVERPGFSSHREVVELSLSQREFVRSDIVIELEDLAVATLNLGGASVDACDLRGRNLRGANLARLKLTGNLGAELDSGCVRCVDDASCAPLDFDSADLSEADLLGATDAASVVLKGANLLGAKLQGLDLTGADLRNANLAAANLTCVDDAHCTKLQDAKLSGANLAGAKLGGAVFSRREPADDLVPCPALAADDEPPFVATYFANTDLSGADLRGVDLRGAIFSGTRFVGAKMNRACLQGQRLVLVDLSEAVLDQADMQGMNATLSVLDQVKMRGARLDDAQLVSSILQGADLSPACDAPLPMIPEAGDRGAGGLPPPLTEGAELPEEPEAPAFEEYEVACASDAQFRRAGCCRTSARGISLIGANLASAVLDGGDFTQADLLGATFGVAVAVGGRPTSAVGARLRLANLPNLDLVGSDFSRADLREVQATGTRFGGTTLVGVDFGGATLVDASFLRNADLTNIDFSDADLRDADLRHAFIYTSNLSRADFTEADLSDVYMADIRAETINFTAANLQRATFGAARPPIVGDEPQEGVIEPREDGDIAIGCLRPGCGDGWGIHFNGADVSGARFARVRSDNGFDFRAAHMLGTEIVDSRLRYARLLDAVVDDLTIVRTDFTGGNLYNIVSPGEAGSLVVLDEVDCTQCAINMNLRAGSRLDHSKFDFGDLGGFWRGVSSQGSTFLRTELVPNAVGLTLVAEELRETNFSGVVASEPGLPSTIAARFIDVAFNNRMGGNRLSLGGEAGGVDLSRSTFTRRPGSRPPGSPDLADFDLFVGDEYDRLAAIVYGTPEPDRTHDLPVGYSDERAIRNATGAVFDGLQSAAVNHFSDFGEFARTDLTRAHFLGATLLGADFQGATLDFTEFRRSTVWPGGLMIVHVAPRPDQPLPPALMTGVSLFGSRWLSEFPTSPGDSTPAVFGDSTLKLSCAEGDFIGPLLFASRVVGRLAESDEAGTDHRRLAAMGADLRALDFSAISELPVTARFQPVAAADLPAHLRNANDRDRPYGCNVEGVDFTEVDLGGIPGAGVGSDLRGLCNAGLAIWDGANLANAIVCTRDVDSGAFGGALGLDTAYVDADCPARLNCPVLEGLCESRYPGCLPDEFECRPGECVAAGMRCDGRSDCEVGPRDPALPRPLGADEVECPDCGPGGFTCGNGVCLAESSRCNGRAECDDASDEMACEACLGFVEDDVVLPGCDELISCQGRETCEAGCVPSSWRLDQRVGCPDYSDEPIVRRVPTFCSFRCVDDAQCVWAAKRCDHVADCNDASDEAHCPYEVIGGVLCPRLVQQPPAAMQRNALCDGVDDCEDGFDEDPVICDGR